MNEVVEKELKVEDLIYEVRGKQIMLDSKVTSVKWHKKICII